MQISVIIPTHNRIQFLEKAITSIINQTYNVFEIILIDDGSNDGTFDMVKKRFPFVELFYQNNRGVSCARNKGIKMARGDWIAFLDSDDEWLPEKLNKQIYTIRTNPNILFYHSNEIWIKDGLRINQGKKHAKYGGRIFEKCLDICRISPSSVVMHKSIFKNIGLFDERLPICEDYDMWLRLTAKYKVFYSNEFLIKKYGGHEDQLSKAPNGIENYRAYAIEKLLMQGELNKIQHMKALDILIKKLKIYKAGLLKREKQKEVLQIEKKIEFWARASN